MDLKDKNILVVGLARTGVSVLRFLCSQGARVTVTDMQDRSALAPWLDKISDLPVNLDLGRHDRHLFMAADLVVVSPGVPMDIIPLQQARAQGRPVVSEVELASRYITAPIVGITGTNGKTTTTTLTGEFFREAGYRTFVGGNIGNPLIELVEEGTRVDRVVVELSSFQLEGVREFRPRVSVLLNITEDHLDRYASYQEYIAAKARLFENQTCDDVAILNMDDPLVAAFAGTIGARVLPMSRERRFDSGIFYDNGTIVWRWDGREESFSTGSMKLQGVHNIDNAMAALAAALVLGCQAAPLSTVLGRFSGLPHRMEFSGTVRGVPYYDDSKGTNVGSVVKSLESFPGEITLIAGGKDKGGDYAPLAELVAERVRHLILIGEARERIKEALGTLTDTRFAGTLEEAVRLAAELTAPTGVVLLSPACSSFDMFTSYSDRGNQFKALVRQLSEELGHEEA